MESINTLTRSGIRYAVELPEYAEDADAAIEWCREHYGEPDLINGRWMPLQFTIQFRERKDRDWYFLRWGA